MNFQKWLKEYEEESNKELKRWQEKTSYKNLIPEGFYENLIQKYNTYRIEMETKNLVKVTWILAIITALVGILNFILILRLK
ncbi:MAG: hypothetical protein V1663_05605 [archaeon]